MILGSVLHIDAIGEKDLAVIPRKDLFDGEYWSGMRKMKEDVLLKLLSHYMIFRDRTEELEKDESLKQIIPYFLIKKDGKYLTARRKNTGGETRLHGGRLIGFGGHLRAEDIKGTMAEWLKREFDEEIETKTILGISFLGIVNHDGEEDRGVGKVHMGLVFEIEVEGKTIIKEIDKFEKEEFLPLKSLEKKKSEMEQWSKLVLEFLIDN
ncbi:hypothetical protein HZB69_01355 [Candidatus Amesbacteria bacterium]|nr:hypothetical protein [Candidatus Amesbacteria bacterium]